MVQSFVLNSVSEEMIGFKLILKPNSSITRIKLRFTGLDLLAASAARKSSPVNLSLILVMLD